MACMLPTGLPHLYEEVAGTADRFLRHRQKKDKFEFTDPGVICEIEA